MEKDAGHKFLGTMRTLQMCFFRENPASLKAWNLSLQSEEHVVRAFRQLWVSSETSIFLFGSACHAFKEPNALGDLFCEYSFLGIYLQYMFLTRMVLDSGYLKLIQDVIFFHFWFASVPSLFGRFQVVLPKWMCVSELFLDFGGFPVSLLLMNPLCPSFFLPDCHCICPFRSATLALYHWTAPPSETLAVIKCCVWRNLLKMRVGWLYSIWKCFLLNHAGQEQATKVGVCSSVAIRVSSEMKSLFLCRFHPG